MFSKRANHASNKSTTTNSLYNYRCMNSPDEISAHT